jgi:hypothetical protein
MKAAVIVNKLLEADPDGIGDLERYAKDTPGYLEDKQLEVEFGLTKLGLLKQKQKQTRQSIRDYGKEVVTYYADWHGSHWLSMTRTMNGIGGASTANPIWAVDVYAPNGHGHAGVEQNDLVDFMRDLLRERRLSSKMTLTLFKEIAEQHGYDVIFN